jgi:hypothetical protein
VELLDVSGSCDDGWMPDDDPIAALTADDIAWLRSHGWEPDAMPTGEAFLERYFRPELISYNTPPLRRPRPPR